MGDRRMAEIKTVDGSLYVYVHSHGYVLPEMAEHAIRKARPRWDDESYATRIIVDQLIKPGRDQELSFGLALKPDMEDEYNGGAPSVIIDLPAQRLFVHSRDAHKLDSTVGKRFTDC